MQNMVYNDIKKRKIYQITIKVIHNNKEGARMLAKYFAKKYEKDIQKIKRKKS